MSRIEPRPQADLAEHEAVFQLIKSAMGFVPSSLRVMAKVPGLFTAFTGLAGTISMMGQIDPGLAQMVANMASNAAGCRYCQAHTAAHASHVGVADDKIAAIWEFETSELFTDAERAALRVARDAASTRRRRSWPRIEPPNRRQEFDRDRCRADDSLRLGGCAPSGRDRAREPPAG